MVKEYKCKIGERVYYENSMTGASRTGVINSEPDELGSLSLIDVGSLAPVRKLDMDVSWWSVTKLEDAMNDKQIMNKIKRESTQYNMTEEEYMKKIKMI